MRFPTETPYSAAVSAAHRFMKEHLCPCVTPEDIRIPSPVLELSAPLGVRYGTAADDGEVKHLLAANMPVFDGIDVFREAYTYGGHVSLGVSDEFMTRFAASAADALPTGRMPERMTLPNSAQYAYVRLRNYSAAYDDYVPSPAKRRALWLCLGLMEERTQAKRQRAYAAAVRAVLAALPCDEGKFGGVTAAAMAALIGRGV